MYYVEKRISKIDDSISLVDYLLKRDDEIMMVAYEYQKDEIMRICELLNGMEV